MGMRAHLIVLVLLFARPGFAEPPNVLSIARPKDGQWLTINMNGVKTGYLFSKLAVQEWEGKPAIVSVEELVLRSKTGDTQRRGTSTII